MAPPKGFIPWNKGKTGIYSAEVLESNRQSHLGRKHSEETKRKIQLKMQQRRLSEEHKRKIGVKTRERQKGKSLQSVYGLIGAVERRAKLGANGWTRRMKGNFPASTLQKKRENMSGKKNPMYGIRGDKSHAWRGGLKLLPYDKRFHKWFKEDIKQRDAWMCTKCMMLEEDHCHRFKGQGLQVHHINYDKQLTVKENCCALCCRCNAEVNFNRPAWTKYFQSILSDKFGYQYDQKGNIILNEVAEPINQNEN